jgi:hypothetical protein
MVEPESFPLEFAFRMGMLLSDKIFSARVAITVNLADIELRFRQSVDGLGERIVLWLLRWNGIRASALWPKRRKTRILRHCFFGRDVGLKFGNGFVVRCWTSRRRMRLM